MGYRNIYISSRSKLSLKRGRLSVINDGERLFPLEDLSCVMVEEGNCTLTGRLLSRLGQAGVLVYFCNEKHLPRAILTGFNSHSRKYKMLKSQLDIKLPLKKRLWQNIVVNKIKNQAEVLGLCKKEGKDELLGIAKAVKPGDPDNMEGVAASKYFRYLFGGGFFRADDNIINARLNYGYSLIRGILCRDTVSYGLEPCLGIHHHSELNSFNLADDLIEPFRPVIDLGVAAMEERDSGLLPSDKRRLFEILGCDVLLDGQRQALSRRAEVFVQSFQNSLLTGENNLKLCEVMPLSAHSYE